MAGDDPPVAAELWRVEQQAKVRAERSLTSPEVGSLQIGDICAVVDAACAPRHAGGLLWRFCIDAPVRGWLSPKTVDRGLCLCPLEPEPPEIPRVLFGNRLPFLLENVCGASCPSLVGLLGRGSSRAPVMVNRNGLLSGPASEILRVPFGSCLLQTHGRVRAAYRVLRDGWAALCVALLQERYDKPMALPPWYLRVPAPAGVTASGGVERAGRQDGLVAPTPNFRNVRGAFLAAADAGGGEAEALLPLLSEERLAECDGILRQRAFATGSGWAVIPWADLLQCPDPGSEADTSCDITELAADGCFQVSFSGEPGVLCHDGAPLTLERRVRSEGASRRRGRQARPQQSAPAVHHGYRDLLARVGMAERAAVPLQHRQGPKMHTVGDSHAMHGWPYHFIQHWLGPVLCYNVHRVSLRELVPPLQEGDAVIFCVGEIDCRCHVHKHSGAGASPGRYEAVIDEVVRRLFDHLRVQLWRLERDVQPIIYNVIPPARRCDAAKDVIMEGSDEERRSYVLAFNGRLRSGCAQAGYTFLDAYDAYADADGFLSDEYSADGLHVAEGWPTVDRLRALGFGRFAEDPRGVVCFNSPWCMP